VTVKTTTGPVTLERPKLRGATAAFASRLFGRHVTKTQRPGDAGDRGVRARAVGARRAGHPLPKRSTIRQRSPNPRFSKVCKAIRAEYQAWARRRFGRTTPTHQSAGLAVQEPGTVPGVVSPGIAVKCSQLYLVHFKRQHTCYTSSKGCVLPDRAEVMP
jgi:hypothetical protein